MKIVLLLLFYEINTQAMPLSSMTGMSPW